MFSYLILYGKRSITGLLLRSLDVNLDSFQENEKYDDMKSMTQKKKYDDINFLQLCNALSLI